MNQPTALIPPSREQLLKELGSAWDVIVIGGGATGLGTAVDAAVRGYKTLLVEAADFAKGTSSRATKLVHGGVRYLSQGNIGLVREALRERGLLLRNAPHLVRPLGFVVPAYSLLDKAFYGTGLKLYDLLARELNLTPSHLLSRSEAVAAVPMLSEQVGGRGLCGGIQYYDAQFDDARLAISLMRTLFDLGGTAINYCPVVGLQIDNGIVSGVSVKDALTGTQFALRARCVVNATGVWVDAIRRMEQPAAAEMVEPSQGVHLVLPKEFLQSERAILVPKTDDGRVVFILPWNAHTIVGTTDTPRRDLPLDPEASAAEIDFLLDTSGRYLRRKPTRDDVSSVWAGLRPLIKAAGAGSTAALSREHTVVVSRAGLISVTGGKWTTYRRMAEDVIDTAIRQKMLSAAPCRTADLKLHGAMESGFSERRGTPDCCYGSELASVRAQPGAQQLLVAASSLTEAHVRHAVRCELACTVDDVLARRNRALFLDSRAALQAAPRVAEILAEELGRDVAWQKAAIEEFERVAARYRISE